MSPALQALTRGLAGHLSQFGQTAVWRGNTITYCPGTPQPAELSTSPRGMEFGKAWSLELLVSKDDSAFTDGFPVVGQHIEIDGKSRRIFDVQPSTSAPHFRLWVIL